MSKSSIIFTGDIGFDKYMDKRWRDEELISKRVLDFFHSADHVAANVEGALIDAGEDSSRSAFFHSMNPEAVCFLEKIGADIWSIGNNHIADAGENGIANTIRLAREKNARTVGAGLCERDASEPIYIEEAGGIGVFGVTYMKENTPATENGAGFFRWDNIELISKRIAEIKEKCRWCVIISHGGEEFSSLPSPYTRERYLKFLELGADVVVGHHPHVTENYELFDNGKAIFYSLGNFVFDTDYQRAHLYTDTGVLLKLIFTEQSLDFDAIGIKIIRQEERIDITELPEIFTNIPETEYNLILPLSLKAFISEERRKMIYLEPERFKNATEEEWNNYFFSTEPDGYDKGAHMDFSILLPLSERADNQEWQSSKLDAVKNYLIKLL